ncbi:unnamed protein product, partial [Pocillopora meandrina]
DFDECQAPDLNNCHKKAKCTNTVGSYNCSCLKGFIGDGVLCRGYGSTCSSVYMFL